MEPITTFRWILGGLQYTNSVEAELTPQSDSKVAVQFKKFNLFGGILSFTAPDRARGELGTLVEGGMRWRGCGKAGWSGSTDRSSVALDQLVWRALTLHLSLVFVQTRRTSTRALFARRIAPRAKACASHEATGATSSC